MHTIIDGIAPAVDHRPEAQTMRLCIPTENDRGADARLARHFGSAPYFTIIDGETVSVVRNPACGHAPGECHHVDILRAHRVEAVVCAGIGRNAFTALERQGIRVFSPAADTVAEAVAAVQSGTAERLALADTCAGHGHHQHHHRQRDRHRHRHGRHCEPGPGIARST